MAGRATGATRLKGLFEDEHEAFRESFRRFCEAEVGPSYPDWRRQGIPRDLFGQLAEHQFVGASVPEEHGGAGIEDFRFGAVICEEAMAANAPGLGLMLAALNEAAIPTLTALATDERGAAWLEGLASGELIAALASGDSPLATTPGDGAVVLNGEVRGVINGGLAEIVAVPVSTGNGSDDLALAVLNADAPGLTRTRSAELVGPNPLDRADLGFDRVEVPADSLLESGAAGALARATLAERLAVAAMCVAGARAALAETLAYVHDRRAFGIPIAQFENTRFALAGVSAEIDATQSFVDACVREHTDGALTAARCAAAKLEASELFCRAVDWCVQLHGGYGYMLEYPIAHTFMAARFLKLHAGTSEELKDLVAGSIGL